jgi:hypothetical protein
MGVCTDAASPFEVSTGNKFVLRIASGLPSSGYVCNAAGQPQLSLVCCGGRLRRGLGLHWRSWERCVHPLRTRATTSTSTPLPVRPLEAPHGQLHGGHDWIEVPFTSAESYPLPHCRHRCTGATSIFLPQWLCSKHCGRRNYSRFAVASGNPPGITFGGGGAVAYPPIERHELDWTSSSTDVGPYTHEHRTPRKFGCRHAAVRLQQPTPGPSICTRAHRRARRRASRLS